MVLFLLIYLLSRYLYGGILNYARRRHLDKYDHKVPTLRFIRHQ